MLFQHFAGYYTTLYYVDGQQVESIGTSPWCIIYDDHHGSPRSQCFENPFKTNVDLLVGG